MKSIYNEYKLYSNAINVYLLFNIYQYLLNFIQLHVSMSAKFIWESSGIILLEFWVLGFFGSVRPPNVCRCI